MRKDCHLVEAAAATDRIVLSLDNRSQRFFAKLSNETPNLGKLIWENPAIDAAGTRTWLEGGARMLPERTLGRLVTRAP